MIHPEVLKEKLRAVKRGLMKLGMYFFPCATLREGEFPRSLGSTEDL